MNNILVVANWKANKTLKETKEWFSKFKIPNSGNVEVAVAPPFTLLSQIDSQSTVLCSQDVSTYPLGSYTGSIPAQLLKEFRVKYVLLGHSESRKYLHQTTQDISLKLVQSIENQITPIICAQTPDEIPSNIHDYKSDQYIVMYEPASAISTNGNYHPDSIENIEATLASWRKNLQCRFLYGGSVNPDNINSFQKLLTANPDLIGANRYPPTPILSGFVIGHASLDANAFSDIVSSLCGLQY